MPKRNPLWKPRKRSLVRFIVRDGVPVPENEQFTTASPASVKKPKEKRARIKDHSRWLDKHQLAGRLDPEMIPPGFTEKR